MFEPSSLLLIAGTAVVAGVLAGLLGIGGGVVIVPALLVVFTTAGVDPEVKVQLAVGTSLATIVLTSISSSWAHHRKGALHWELVPWFVPGLIVGAVGGAALAVWMPGLTLQLVFGVFLVAIAARLVFGKLPEEARERVMPVWLMIVGGTLIGAISAMVGIGGGLLSVPLLVLAAGLPINHGVGTAPFFGLILSIVGTITFVLQGLSEPLLPSGCVGYVALVPAALMAIGTVSLAPVGAWLAHRLPRRALSIAFSVVVFLVAVRLIWDAVAGMRGDA